LAKYGFEKQVVQHTTTNAEGFYMGEQHCLDGNNLGRNWL